MAATMGVDLLREEEYRALQRLGECDEAIVIPVRGPAPASVDRGRRHRENQRGRAKVTPATGAVDPSRLRYRDRCYNA